MKIAQSCFAFVFVPSALPIKPAIYFSFIFVILYIWITESFRYAALYCLKICFTLM